MPKHGNTEDFIKNAKLIHGDKFNYDQVDYIGCNQLVKIICKEHGVFEQTPRNHLQKKGCRKCRVWNKKKTTDEFIENARKIHGDKYDYSQVIYLGCEIPVIIICREHGPFEKIPGRHLCQGHGCSKCAGKNITTDDFIERSKKHHGDKFDYSRVVYKNSQSRVEIICQVHGLFTQIAASHMVGHDCAKCSRRIVTNEMFIEKARKVHGDKYDYEKVEYTDKSTEVKITCKIHGDFMQVPNTHLDGSGCPTCGKTYSRGEHMIEQWLKKKNIAFETQKTFPECKYKALLKFDFFFEEYNLCIEFDGKQHFEYDDHFGENEFDNIKKRDAVKYEFCKKNNINLLRLKDYNVTTLENKLENGFKLVQAAKLQSKYFVMNIDYDRRNYQKPELFNIL